jgi:hypothetical protein
LNFCGAGKNRIYLKTDREGIAVAVKNIATARRNRHNLLLMLRRFFDIGSGFDDLKEAKTRTNPKSPNAHEGRQDTNTSRR